MRWNAILGYEVEVRYKLAHGFGSKKTFQGDGKSFLVRAKRL